MSKDQNKGTDQNHWLRWVEYEHPTAPHQLPDFKRHDGLVPVIVQDMDSSCVYPLLYTRETELMETRQTRKPVFYSIYRQARFDGVMSDGTTPIVKEIFVDSVGGSLLYLVSEEKEVIDTCPKRSSSLRFWLGWIQVRVNCLKNKFRNKKKG